MAALAYALILAAVAAALGWALTGLYVRLMSARPEAPNERSMHTVPVPAGAGLAIVVATGLPWLAWQGSHLEAPRALLLTLFAALAAVSWIDDRRALSPLVRLGLHALAVALCLWTLPAEAQALPFLPLGLERVLTAVAWLWFINLFNFMDGIDGLAGSEAVALALGYTLLFLAGGLDSRYASLALFAAAASVGYLFWNWHPAKVFMGDAGSIPLGFLLGWLLIDLAVHRHLAAAAILPLYFVADATITLFRRILRGDRPWEAHREHYYQRAVLGGASPPAVVARVTLANTVLLALALWSLTQPALALAAAIAVVGGLLANLEGLARKRSAS
jgi:UDP-N-acetylmuramyl pentapeptide phosphotransferase/UDP-N-acetylglucosamine-1-phosphate transferase